MSREWGLRWFFFLLGAAVGAAVQGVGWLWWVWWAVAMGSWVLVAYWHRNGGPAHA